MIFFNLLDGGTSH